MSDASDRTIPATPRRRQAAEEDGLVPTAGIVAWAVAVSIAFACLPASVRVAGESAVGWLRDLLATVGQPSAPPFAPPPASLIAIGLGLVVVVLAATLGVRGLFDRVRLRPTRCLPDARRIGLFRGTARIFSGRTLLRTFESAVSAAVVGTAAAFSLGPLFTGLGDAIVSEPTSSLLIAWRSLWPVVAAAAAIAFVRWAFARIGFERRLRMTPQEYREEIRSLEADKKVKLERHQPRRPVPASALPAFGHSEPTGGSARHAGQTSPVSGTL